MNQLGLIALGTNGSDGNKDNVMEPGIHLRWMFNHKRGFPKNKFKLLRRPTATQKYSSELGRTSTAISGHKFYPGGNGMWYHGFLLETADGETVDLVDRPFAIADSAGNKPKGIRLTSTPFELKFSSDIARVEFDFDMSPGNWVHVEALYQDRVVAEEYYKPNLLDSVITNVNLSAYKIDRIRMRGQDCLFGNIRWYPYAYTDANWEDVEIPGSEDNTLGPPSGGRDGNGNGDSGSGDGTDETDPCRKSNARDRLSSDKLCDFTDEDISDLQDAFDAVADEGSPDKPVGSTFNEQTAETNGCDDNAPHGGMSEYDRILAQSSDPEIAKMAGLYFIDTDTSGQLYDYKIEANWPSDTYFMLDNDLDFDDAPLGYQPGQQYVFENGYFSGMGLQVVDATDGSGDFAKAKKAIQYTPWQPYAQFEFRLIDDFAAEFQIYVEHTGNELEVDAFHYYFGKSDPHKFRKKKGILRINGYGMYMLRFRGTGIKIYRIKYDREWIRPGDFSQTICAVREEQPTPLQLPHHLVGMCLAGQTKRMDAECTERLFNYKVGLKWDHQEHNMTSPIAYHLDETFDGNTSWITEGNPVVVGEVDSSKKEYIDCDGNILDDRPEFIHGLQSKGIYGYSVWGVDLFGRSSEKSELIPIDVRDPTPTPPSDIEAKFVDLDDMHPENTNTGLTDDDKEFIFNAGGPPGILLKWKWTEYNKLLTPTVKNFRVHLLDGWQNVLQGEIESVSQQGDDWKLVTTLPTHLQNVIGSLRQNNIPFEIQSSSQETIDGEERTVLLAHKLRQQTIDLVDTDRPSTGAFALMLSEDSDSYKEYDKNETWDTLSPGVIDELEITDQVADEFTHFVPLDPSLWPDFNLTFDEIGNQYAGRKIVYGQVCMSTTNGDNNKSSVSKPIPIIANYKAPPRIIPPLDTGDVFIAEPLDYYGKSKYIYEWNAPADPSVCINVYRAMDDTLWHVDKANRTSRTNDEYEALIDEVAELMEIEIGREDRDLIKTVENYADLSPTLQKIVAALKDNQRAFSKLNDKPLKGETTYTDTSLSGGSTRFFYRTQPVDDSNRVGPMGLPSMPVEIPPKKVHQPPVITKLTGGNYRNHLQWTCLDEDVVSFIIYRSENKDDLLSVEQAKCSQSAVFHHYNTGGSTTFTYDDREVEVGVVYHYAVSALYRNGSTWIEKGLSASKSAQAFDDFVPGHPSWRTIRSQPDGITITWAYRRYETGHRRVSKVKVLRTEWGSNDYEEITDWMNGSTVSYTDKSIDPDKQYMYALKVMGTSGKVSTEISPIIDAWWFWM